MAQVVLENATKIYPGGVQAVNNVSVRIEDQEFVVLVGPSGCGKSTTLRMIAGLEEVTSGRILIGGRMVNDLPPKDRDIAMVFQNYAMYPHLTVYSNMAFGLRLRHLPKDEIDRRVRRAAQMLGIEELLNRKPRALSGGQRQRVAVGRAVVRTPQAFLFDEPLSNLDARLRIEMRAELKRLHRELAATTIYVTHDQEEAMTLGDRVVVMKDGVVHQIGTPLEVYRHPANRFVAGFVGVPPMNFFAGRVLAQDGELYFDEGPNRIRLPQRLQRDLAGREGQRMVLGVRPEALSNVPQGRFAGQENRLNVTIRSVDVLGDRMDVHVRTATHDSIVCRLDTQVGRPGGLLEKGNVLAMYLDMNRVHVFEPGDEGVNVSRNTAGEHASAA